MRGRLFKGSFSPGRPPGLGPELGPGLCLAAVPMQCVPGECECRGQNREEWGHSEAGAHSASEPRLGGGCGEQPGGKVPPSIAVPGAVHGRGLLHRGGPACQAVIHVA